MTDYTFQRSYDNPADDIFFICLNVAEILRANVTRSDPHMGKLILRIGAGLLTWGSVLEIEVIPQSINQCLLSINAFPSTAIGTRNPLIGHKATSKHLDNFTNEVDKRVQRAKLKYG